MLMTALAVEVAQYVDAHQEARDEAGRRLVVRNGRGDGAEGDLRSWDAGGLSATGERQARGRSRPAQAVHQSDLAPVYASFAEGRGGAADPLSARAVDGRFPRSAAGAVGG